MNHYANIFIIIGKIGISILKTKTHAHRMLLLRQKSIVKQIIKKRFTIVRAMKQFKITLGISVTTFVCGPKHCVLYLESVHFVWIQYILLSVTLGNSFWTCFVKQKLCIYMLHEKCTPIY